MSDAPAPPSSPVWKNPFVLAFVLGAAALTALPFMQQRFLKAPPPLRALGTWELPTLDGGTVGSATLRGRVWIAQVLAADCMPGCRERLEAQAKLVPHLADLEHPVAQVTFVVPHGDQTAMPRALVALATGDWFALTAPLDRLEPVVSAGLRAAMAGWARGDAGADALEFAAVPGFSLVDQNGEVRGFWAQDDLARGNLINAARLLSRRGPEP